MEDGDEDILRKAAGLIDFMGVNYYQSCVVEHNPIDGVGTTHEMNTTGKKGTAKVQGVPGLYKNPANEFLRQTGIGPSIRWDFACAADRSLQDTTFRS